MTSSVGNVGVKSQLTGPVDRCQLVIPCLSGKCQASAVRCRIVDAQWQMTAKWQASDGRYRVTDIQRQQRSDVSRLTAPVTLMAAVRYLARVVRSFRGIGWSITARHLCVYVSTLMNLRWSELWLFLGKFDSSSFCTIIFKLKPFLDDQLDATIYKRYSFLVLNNFSFHDIYNCMCNIHVL